MRTYARKISSHKGPRYRKHRTLGPNTNTLDLRENFAHTLNAPTMDVKKISFLRSRMRK